MVSTLDKKFTNEHGKYSQFDKYKSKVLLEKEKKEPILKTDISQKDIDLSKSKAGSKLDLETARTLSGNPTLTQDELNKLKAAAKKKEIVEPTGKFKNE
jgi:hypothetical protein